MNTTESEGFTLDTPEAINAWVLLSRVHQCHLHMDGLKVPGLLKWLKANIPDCADARTVKAAYPRLLDYCDERGIVSRETERCNYQVFVHAWGLLHDWGIFDTIDEIEANADFVARYNEGRLTIVRTMNPVRDRDPKIQMIMENPT